MLLVDVVMMKLSIYGGDMSKMNSSIHITSIINDYEVWPCWEKIPNILTSAKVI